MEKIAAQTKLTEGVDSSWDDDPNDYYQYPPAEGRSGRRKSRLLRVARRPAGQQFPVQRRGGFLSRQVLQPRDRRSQLRQGLSREPAGETPKFNKDTGVPKQTSVDLSMVKLKMGCIAAGKATLGNRQNQRQLTPVAPMFVDTQLFA